MLARIYVNLRPMPLYHHNIMCYINQLQLQGNRTELETFQMAPSRQSRSSRSSKRPELPRTDREYFLWFIVSCPKRDSPRPSLNHIGLGKHGHNHDSDALFHPQSDLFTTSTLQQAQGRAERFQSHFCAYTDEKVHHSSHNRLQPRRSQVTDLFAVLTW